MSEREIDPALVSAWVAQARAVIQEFVADCDNVEYAGERGINILGFASFQSARLRQELERLEEKAEKLRYRKAW